MTYEEFITLTDDPAAGDSLEPRLRSLWYDKRGNWDEAHTIAQGIHTEQGSAIHAYLHREEGDLGNAGYWYSRAGRQMPKTGLDEEWQRLTREMLG